MKIKSSQKTLGMILLTIAMTFGCASQQKQEPAPAAKGPSAAETAIAEAEAAIKKAKSLDWIWRDTEKDLKKAKEALAKGDEEKAIKLANTARDQAELAVKQYYYEQGVDRAMPPDSLDAFLSENFSSLVMCNNSSLLFTYSAFGTLYIALKKSRCSETERSG